MLRTLAPRPQIFSVSSCGDHITSTIPASSGAPSWTAFFSGLLTRHSGPIQLHSAENRSGEEVLELLPLGEREDGIEGEQDYGLDDELEYNQGIWEWSTSQGLPNTGDKMKFG